MNAVDEMSVLNRDMKAFLDANGADYPVWRALERGGREVFAMKYAGMPMGMWGAVRGVLPQAADRCIRL